LSIFARRTNTTGAASRTTLELGEKRGPGVLEAVAGAENQTSNPSEEKKINPKEEW